MWAATLHLGFCKLPAHSLRVKANFYSSLSAPNKSNFSSPAIFFPHMFFFRRKNGDKSVSAASSCSSLLSTSASCSSDMAGSMNGVHDLTAGDFQKQSLPCTSRFSSSSTLLAQVSPSSPSSMSRNLCFKPPRQLPESYVRHAKILSDASGSIATESAMTSTLPESLQNHQRSFGMDLPPELLPVINLMNAQKLRQYVAGTIELLSNDRTTWLSAEATLTGIELAVSTFGSGAPRYFNLQDSSIVPTPIPGSSNAGYDLLILHDFDSHLSTLRFFDTEQLYTWLAAIHLAKFENTSLQEAFTAVVMSLKGPELSDIYTLLSHKQRFTRYEWSNIRLPQLSNKWIKVFVIITPGDNKKDGRVEVYASDKTSKKNLVLYVDALDCVYNVYPEDYRMIDLNLIMKLEGRIFVSKSYQHLFMHGNEAFGNTSPNELDFHSINKSDSAMSLSSFGLSIANLLNSSVRFRSNSISSSCSFFVNSSTPLATDNDELLNSFRRAGHFLKKSDRDNFVQTDYLYLMPQQHPGVSALEIMLRNFIYFIDSFKLYGRPEHISSNKRDPVSMLFGMPALPRYCYMDLEDAFEVIAVNFEFSCMKSWRLADWRWALKEYLCGKQANTNFKGSGSIYELFHSFESSIDAPTPPGLRIADQYRQSLNTITRGSFEDVNRRSLGSLASKSAPRYITGICLDDTFNYKKEKLTRILYPRQSLQPIADLPASREEKTLPAFVVKENSLAVHI